MAHLETNVVNEDGQVVPGATVTVYLAGTTTEASLFSDSALATSLANPTTTDTAGKVDVYLAAGNYDILVQRADIDDRTLRNVAIVDERASVIYWMTGTTTDANQTELYLDGDSNQITIPADSVSLVEAHIVGHDSGTGQSAAYVVRAAVENDGGTTAVIGSVDAAFTAEDDSAWGATLAADDTNDAVRVLVTGEAGITVAWSARVMVVES